MKTSVAALHLYFRAVSFISLFCFFCAFFRVVFVVVAGWNEDISVKKTLSVVDGTGTEGGTSVWQAFLCWRDWYGDRGRPSSSSSKKKLGALRIIFLFLWWHGLYVRRCCTVFLFFIFQCRFSCLWSGGAGLLLLLLVLGADGVGLCTAGYMGGTVIAEK